MWITRHLRSDHRQSPDSLWYRRTSRLPRFHTAPMKLRFCLRVVKMWLPEAGRPGSGTQEKPSDSLPRPPLNNTSQCHRSVALPDTTSLDTCKSIAYDE